MNPRRARMSIAIFGLIVTFGLVPCAAEGQGNAAAVEEAGALRPQGLPVPTHDPSDCRPPFEPSHELHVSPSKEQTNSNFGGPDFWSRKGYNLRELLGEIYDVEAPRIALPAKFDDGKRYDLALVTPEPQDLDAMHQLARQGINEYLHGSLVRERRMVDVYVVTTAGGTPPPANPLLRRAATNFNSMGISFDMDDEGDEAAPSKRPSLSAVRSLSMGEGTAEDFRRSLEASLDRPVVDETGLTGVYNFAMKGDENANSIEEKNDFLERVRDQLHLTIKPGRRNVETLVFHPN